MTMLSRTRLVVTVMALAALIVLPTAGSAPTSAQNPTSRLQSALIGQINAFRASHGLAPLRESRRLDAAARSHSRQMARLGYFSHDSANGTSFLDRVRQFYPVRGY